MVNAPGCVSGAFRRTKGGSSMTHDSTSDSKYTMPDGEGKGAARDSVYGDFPRELLERRRQIVNYKLGLRPRRNKPDELAKTPYNPRTGEPASVDDPDTWGTA